MVGWLRVRLVGVKQLQNCCRFVLPAMKGPIALLFIQYSYYILNINQILEVSVAKAFKQRTVYDSARQK